MATSSTPTTPPPTTRPPFAISRYTIHDPHHGDKPRSRRALNATIALGTILDKREWWTKWTQCPDTRADWMRDIAKQLIVANAEQVLAAWPARGDVGRALEPILAIADAAAEEKQATIDRVIAHVLYPPPHWPFDGFRLGTDYESDDEYRTDERRDEWHVDLNDAFETEAIDLDFERVLAHHETQNSFGQIGWYMAMDALRNELEHCRAELATCSREDLEGKIRLNGLLMSAGMWTWMEICDVVLNEKPCTLALVAKQNPDKKRVNVLRLLHRHFEKIIAFLESTKQDITTILDLVIKYAHLNDESHPNTVGLSPGPVPQTWLSDTAIPRVLKERFAAQVAVLENVPDDQKDWRPSPNKYRPGAKDQVLDLVHPSLHCGTIGVTPVLPKRERDAIPSTAVDHMRSIMFAATPDRLAGPPQPFLPPRFQWLPSEFEVSEDGSETTIRSYINNLHPETHADLYDSIAAIFTRFVPLFDQVVSSLDEALVDRGDLSNYVLRALKQGLPVPTASGREEVVETLTHELDGATPSSSLRRLVPPGLFEFANPRFSLKGSRCQVIVEISEIVLTPEKPNYFGDSWHVEGTDAERIVATGLYYFASENITESRLSFRTFVGAPRADLGDFVGVGLTYGLAEQDLLVQGLGSLSAIEDRCVVFPNLYQHRTEPFQLDDPTKPGVRKVLAFYLVDPVNEPVPSTATVPPQQDAWIERARAEAPEGVGVMEREGLSLDAARATRLELMHKRSLQRWDTMLTLSHWLGDH